MEINFTKMNGAGNDFVVLDNRDGKYDVLDKAAIEKLKLYGAMGLAMAKSLPAAFIAPKGSDEMLPPGYRQDFEQAPGTLDDEDDDEEDVGRVQLDSNLNYDSDDKEGEGNELISLDSVPAQRKTAKKLAGPPA